MSGARSASIGATHGGGSSSSAASARPSLPVDRRGSEGFSRITCTTPSPAAPRRSMSPASASAASGDAMTTNTGPGPASPPPRLAGDEARHARSRHEARRSSIDAPVENSHGRAAGDTRWSGSRFGGRAVQDAAQARGRRARHERERHHAPALPGSRPRSAPRGRAFDQDVRLIAAITPPGSAASKMVTYPRTRARPTSWPPAQSGRSGPLSADTEASLLIATISRSPRLRAS
jgi:hypothetical protein